jgi:hypothetical protein
MGSAERQERNQCGKDQNQDERTCEDLKRSHSQTTSTLTPTPSGADPVFSPRQFDNQLSVFAAPSTSFYLQRK